MQGHRRASKGFCVGRLGLRGLEAPLEECSGTVSIGRYINLGKGLLAGGLPSAPGNSREQDRYQNQGWDPDGLRRQSNSTLHPGHP